VRRKERVVDDATYNYLEKIAALLDIVKACRAFWQFTQANVTLQRLATLEATLMRISEAVQAEDYRLERFAAAIYGL
jgi:hypothetical protein